MDHFVDLWALFQEKHHEAEDTQSNWLWSPKQWKPNKGSFTCSFPFLGFKHASFHYDAPRDNPTWLTSAQKGF